MGRHRMQDATPSEDDRLEGTRQLPLAAAVRRRRKVVFGAAAGVVSVLAIGGVVTLARGFAPAQARACAPTCATERSSGPEAAEQRPSASHTPRATPTAHDAGRTFAPTVVRQRKQAKPRPTDTGSPPPIETPRPPWHGHWPPHHWPGPW